MSNDLRTLPFHTSQHPLSDRLNLDAATAVRGWIFSRLPLPELAQHLENVITTLYARPDLPGVTEWLRPVHSWYVSRWPATTSRWPATPGSPARTI